MSNDPYIDTHIATLTNVNGSDLKVVSTDVGSVKVDKLVNNGITTFTTPSKETSVPSYPVAMIENKDTGDTVAVIETKKENITSPSSNVNTTQPKVIAILNNVDGANLKVVGSGE